MDTQIHAAESEPPALSILAVDPGGKYILKEALIASVRAERGAPRANDDPSLMPRLPSILFGRPVLGEAAACAESVEPGVGRTELFATTVPWWRITTDNTELMRYHAPWLAGTACRPHHHSARFEI